MTPNVCCPECGFEITKALAQARTEALGELIVWIADMDPELADAARKRFLNGK